MQNNMANQLIQTNAAAAPVSISASTGLSVVQSFLAKSGFNYQVGIRNTHGLLIIEGVAEGTTCMFLCGIQVYDKESGHEICNIPVPKSTQYSRQLVMSLVVEHLSNAIAEAAICDGKALDMLDVRKQVTDMLDDCYFKQSRQAALSWAERVGIIH